MSKVIIAMPVYNGMPFVKEAIASALAQTYENFELIVIDNASTDGTVAAVREIDDPRVRLVQNETNIGAVPNWQKACEFDDAEYWKLLCADDLLDPRCLELQVRVLDDLANTNATFASCRRHVIDDKGKLLFSDRGLSGLSGYVSGSRALRATAQSGTNPFGEPAAVLVRSEALRQAGSFRDKGYMIDVDLWARLMALPGAGVVAMDDTLASFRVSVGSWSNSIGSKQASQARDMVNELREAYPETVTKLDVARGLFMATAQGFARQVVYALMKRGLK